MADEAGSDPWPDAAGGEGGHGAPKPDVVIHRQRVVLTPGDKFGLGIDGVRMAKLEKGHLTKVHRRDDDKTPC